MSHGRLTSIRTAFSVRTRSMGVNRSTPIRRGSTRPTRFTDSSRSRSRCRRDGGDFACRADREGRGQWPKRRLSVTKRAFVSDQKGFGYDLETVLASLLVSLGVTSSMFWRQLY